MADRVLVAVGFWQTHFFRFEGSGSNECGNGNAAASTVQFVSPPEAGDLSSASTKVAFFRDGLDDKLTKSGAQQVRCTTSASCQRAASASPCRWLGRS